MIKFRSYKYPLNFPGKRFTILFSGNYTFKSHNIYQEQTLLFLDLMFIFSFIAIIFLKVIDFIIWESLNSIKKNCFAGVGLFTTS